MFKNYLILILLVISSSSYAQQQPYSYQGKVSGMVCAFCVYNVSKKIAKLPEIDPASVDVNLKTKLVNFNSSSKVSFTTLAAVFSDSGFKLTELKQVSNNKSNLPAYQNSPVIEFRLDNLDISQYQSVLESIGDIAAKNLGKLVIKAPQSIELELLKPMIIGKQQVAKIQFDIEKSKKDIEISLYLKK